MNKKFIVMAAFAAMFGMAFTACTNNDDEFASGGGGGVETSLKDAISYAPVLDGKVVTRGTEVTDAGFKVDGKSFKVVGYFATGASNPSNPSISAGLQYIGTSNNGIVVTADGDPLVWNPAQTAYWPGADLNFQAVSPSADQSTEYVLAASAISTKDSKNIPTLAYVCDLPVITANQQDLIFAQATGQNQSNAGSGVSLDFSHATSQVVFNAYLADNTLQAQINSIEICNLYKNATIGYAAPTTTATTDAGVLTVTAPATQNYAAFGVDPAAGTHGGIVGDAAVTVTSDDEDDPDALSATAGALFMIPQDRSGEAWGLNGSAAETAEAGVNDKSITQANTLYQTYIKIGCKIQMADNNYILGAAGSWGYVYIPLEVNWAMGTKYIYTIKIGAGSGGYDENGNPLMAPISYVVNSVAAWGTSEIEKQF